MNENTEKKGVTHTVTREQIIVGRKKIELPGLDLNKNIDDVDLGKPMNEEGYQALKEFVETYLSNLELDFENSSLEALISLIAKQVETDFQFVEQGSGIATVSKQLEDYKEELSKHGKASPENFDCKLPTTITGMIIASLVEKHPIQSIKLLTKPRGSHPHLLVQSNEGKAYLVDFRLVKPKNERERATESKMDIRIFDQSVDFDKKVLDRTLGMVEQLDLTVPGIAKLDQYFIDS